MVRRTKRQMRERRGSFLESEILFEFDKDALLVANTGLPFTRKGVISVCASHLSDKQSGGVTDHFIEVDDQDLVRTIRSNELDHYKDPNRITADFNNQREIVHDYGGRFVWELLQNADDAMGKGRSSDVLIGSKGLGFKAVLEITDKPEIHSLPFHFHFSASKTQKLLKERNLHEDPPPLTFRIPHECKPSSRIGKLLHTGYTTVVRLPFRSEDAGTKAMDRLRSIDPLFLLLAQELSCVRIRLPGGETVHDVARSKPGLSNGNLTLTTSSMNGYSSVSWRRWVRCRPAPTEKDKQLSVAICLPLTEGGEAVAHNMDVPLHAFFPTEEQTGTRALIHASFDLEHNRKRVRKSDYDNEILNETIHLLRDMVDDVPARTTLEVFRNILIENGNSPSAELKKKIWDTLCETRFVPVIGGARAKPAEVLLWNDGLGSTLQEANQRVRVACLLVPELSDLANILEDYGANHIEPKHFIRLLRHCRNDTLHETMASWCVLVGGGLKRISKVYSSKRDQLLEILRDVPCWWTEIGVARALVGTHALLIERPADWPDWLPVDALHPRMREEWKQLESDMHAGEEIVQLRSQLILGRLLTRKQEYLHDVLLPFVEDWDNARWNAEGWMILHQVLSWSANRKFKNIAPWVEHTEGNQEEKRRIQAGTALCIPTDKGWLPAVDCYAGAAWRGHSQFDSLFASIERRGLVLSFEEWPNHVRTGTDKNRWMALLRWAGVSWEPKVRRIEALPEHSLVDDYLSDSNAQDYTYWIVDWEIEYFSDYIHTSDGSRPDMMIKAILSLANVVQKPVAMYKYYTEKSPSTYANFAEYQLRNEAWLPCRESVLHNNRRVAPYQAFLPNKGFNGLLPEVDKSRIGDEEWFGRILPALRSLGIREQLSDNPSDWHEWMQKLAEIGKQLGESREGDGRLKKAANALYRGYLKLAGECGFPEDIHIPCFVWKNGRERVNFSPPSEVCHVDEPHFDEVSQEIIRTGHKLFIVSLSSGNRAPERLGVRLLSDVLSAEPLHDRSDEPISLELRQRYNERRKGLSIAAHLPTHLPAKLEIIAVRDLRLHLMASGKPVTEVQVLSWKDKDGELLVNLDKDKWRALGHALAARIADKESHSSLFENLLRESDKESYLDRLRHQGVTEDDVREAENALTPYDLNQQNLEGGAPDQEPRQERMPVEGPEQHDLPSLVGAQEEPRTPHDPGNGNADEARSRRTATSSSRNLSGNTSRRPKPDVGLDAEAWLYEKLEDKFDMVERHVRDDKNRESDFVVSSGDRKFHIEVKHVENKPGTIYWSGLQWDKAREFRNPVDEFYCMAILFPDSDGTFEIRWIWDPLNELRNVSREVQWEGHTEYIPVNANSWDIQMQRPDEVPTKRHKFRIKLNDEVLDRFERDTEALTVLRKMISVHQRKCEPQQSQDP